MKTLKLTMWSTMLVLAMSVPAFAKSGTISTTKAGTISTTRTGTISTTAAGTNRTGTISTTRTDVISTPSRTSTANFGQLSLLELLLTVFGPW
jgi:hypothetical protein